MIDKLSTLPYDSFLALVLGFGFLIFIHEMGHFLVAKAVGIRCTQFAIGFGQSLLTWRKGIGLRVGSTEAVYEKRAIAHLNEQKATPHPGAHQTTAQYDDFTTVEQHDGKYTPHQIYEAADALGLGETEYRFNWMPLGGYVKMLGQEDLDPDASSEDPRAFNNKPIWARTAVISAGVVMNALFGLVFFVVAFSIGVNFPSATVGFTVPGSPAATTYADGHADDPAYFGLQAGDRIISINDKPIRDITGVKIATALGGQGDLLHFEIHRPTPDQALAYTLVAEQAVGQRLLTVGIIPTPNTTVEVVLKDSLASKAGVRGGMHVTAVDGQPVSTYAQFSHAVQAKRGLPTTVTLTDPQTQTQAQVAMHAQAGLVQMNSTQPANLLGLVPATRLSPMKDSPAAQAGVQKDDLLARLGQTDWPSVNQVRQIILDADGPLELAVFRAGEIQTLKPVTPNYKGFIGISLAPVTDTLIVGQTLPNTPAATLNLVGGSKLLALNGTNLTDWTQLQRLLTELPTETSTLSLRYQLNLAHTPVESSTLTLTRADHQQLACARWLAPRDVAFQGKMTTVQASNPVEAMKLGMQYTSEFILQTYVTLRRLFEGSVSIRDLRGPAGIVDAGTQATEQGWSYYWFFLGLISVNLAVINFLPVPIVDGGHIVFLFIEKIKGSPASPAIQVGAMWVGLALIGTLFLIVTYNDIARIFFGIN